MSPTQQPPEKFNLGVVKQVISGDTIVIRNKPKEGPPKEKILGLSNITAPRLGRRIGNEDNCQEVKDEPFAWEAREFLRKKLIGKEVLFTTAEKSPPQENKDAKPPQREYGYVYLGKDGTSVESPGENVAESLVAEGLVDVRKGKANDEKYQALVQLEDSAKAAGKGKHGPDAATHVRDVKWTIGDPQKFMECLHYKSVDAVVEHVRNGSTLRLLLLPDFHSITLMLSGIRCPVARSGFGLQGQGDGPSEPYGEEARFFTESRLLNRDVKVILESVSNQNFWGTVLHPNGNIAELLVREGFAKCVDWTLQRSTTGAEKLRSLEKLAREEKKRWWKILPVVPTSDGMGREFLGKIMEVINADALLVKLPDGNVKKIFLASIRPPRLPEEKTDISKEKERVRPLYDIPYMFEAREFLRKKLIGKKVNITVDYVQTAKENFPEKTCCTVTTGGVNVAEALVSKGLATTVRYRADDDQRSAHYSELLAAESKAQKSGKGVHSKKTSPPHRVVDLSGDLAKSKQFLPFLHRAGRMEAIVEFVASGSRLRLYVPRENCLLTFLLAGITCPRVLRTDIKSGNVRSDPWGEEALAFTKDLCMQREVEVQVEAMDKAGNFIGWLWIENVNLSVSLVQEGFAEVHSTAERSPHYRQLQQAENDAKNKKTRLWNDYVPVETEPKEEEAERKVDMKAIQVTEVRPELAFYAQYNDSGPMLVEMLRQLRHEFATNIPLTGAYMPRKNDLCAAIFSADGAWYRAKIEKIEGKSVHVLFVDYGNREITSVTNLAALPIKYEVHPVAATEFHLAFVHVPKDAENAEDAKIAFEDSVYGASLLLNVEYKVGSIQYVTLTTNDDKKTDIGKELVERGYLCVEKRKEKRFQKIISEYLTAQDTAKKNRLNLWCYGDITEDDAKEFG